MERFKPFLIFFAAVVLILLIKQFALPFFKSNNSILQVETPGIVAKVFLNNEEVGQTPYLGQKIREGDYDVRIEATLPNLNANLVFSRRISLTSQAITAINYDFGSSALFSSGDIRSSRSGDGLSIITSPSGADISLNGEDMGQGPVSLNPKKGVHKLTVSKDGYFSRELQINIEPGKRLIVEVFLTLNPIGAAKKIQSGETTIYDLSSRIEKLNSDTSEWAKGVFFYESKKNLNLDLLIDKQGKTFYNRKGEFDKKVVENKPITIGYLDDLAEQGLSQAAKATLATATKQVVKEGSAQQSQAKVQILSTPTDTLNVRSGPGTGNSIVSKVKPGETYTLLSEQSGWYKIKLSSSEGWISTQYAKKL